MDWNEKDHPRDEEGKFTNKGGEAKNQTKNSKEIKPFKLSAEFNEIKKSKNAC